MDFDNEMQRLKWLLVAGVLFLLSAVFSYGELKFAVWGKTAPAKVTRTHETHNGGGFGRRGLRERTPLLAVEYQFTEADGTARSERDDVPIDWPMPENGEISVQYLPGVADSSRLEGHSRMTWVYVFLGSLAWLAYSIYKLWREATEAVRGSGRRRGR
jgi:hypothetical protein